MDDEASQEGYSNVPHANTYEMPHSVTTKSLGEQKHYIDFVKSPKVSHSVFAACSEHVIYESVSNEAKEVGGT